MKNLHKPLSSAIFFLLLSLFSTAHAQHDGYIHASYEILPGSSIQLKGSTNINKFECFAEELSPAISAYVMPSPHENALLLKDSQIKVPVIGLECGQEPINRDLRKTLKASEYPEIIVQLNRVHFTDQYDCEPDKVAVEASLYIAGAKEPACIVLNGNLDRERNQFNVHGEHSVHLTNFGIEPPTTFFGLIKVHDKISITFDFSFKKDEKTTRFGELLKDNLSLTTQND